MLEPVRFKKSLLGFSREQVIDYIARMDQNAALERKALSEQYEAKLSSLRRELEQTAAQGEQYRTQADAALSRVFELEETIQDLSHQVEAAELLRRQLADTEAQREEWKNKFMAMEGEMERLSREAAERESRLSEFIDRVQEKNVELLQKQVAMEIKLSNTERELFLKSSPRGEGAQAAVPPEETVYQDAREDIIAALDSILSKLDSLGGKDAPGGQVYRLAERS